MKKIFAIVFLLGSIFYGNVFSMFDSDLEYDLLGIKDSFDGDEYSDLEDFFPDLYGEKFSEKDDFEVINKIIELQKKEDGLSEKEVKKLLRIFIIKLYETVYGKIDFNVALKIRDFLSYLRENQIDAEYLYLKNLLGNFKKSSTENKERIRALANTNLSTQKALSFEEKLIKKRMLFLQNKRMKNNRKRRFKVENLLIKRWYELCYGKIKDNHQDLNTTEFYKILTDNNIKINSKALSSILTRLKSSKINEDIELNLILPKVISFEENQIINKILKLETKRKVSTKRQIRMNEEVALILKLYVVCYGNPGKKIKLKSREFLQYLSENNIIMSLESLRGILRNFKKLSESEILKKLEFADNCLQKKKIQSSSERKIINKIINLKNETDSKDLTPKKRAEIINGFLIKLYELLYGSIKQDIKLDIVSFLNYLKGVGYLEENEYKKVRLRIKQSLLAFKKLSEDKKEKKRVRIDNLL